MENAYYPSICLALVYQVVTGRLVPMNKSCPRPRNQSVLHESWPVSCSVLRSRCLLIKAMICQLRALRTATQNEGEAK
jgi:hypothetical protein